MNDPNGFTVIDDTSPFIQYDSSWTNQLSGYRDNPDSPALATYYNRTYVVSHEDDACIRVAFVGTKISVYGTKRVSHGWYSTVVDEDPETAERDYQSGYSVDEVTNMTLFTATLPVGTHRFYMYNEPKYNAEQGKNVLGLDAIHFDGYPVSLDSADLASSSATSTSTFVSSSNDAAVALTAISAGPALPSGSEEWQSTASLSTTRPIIPASIVSSAVHTPNTPPTQVNGPSNSSQGVSSDAGAGSKVGHLRWLILSSLVTYYLLGLCI